MTDPTSTFSEMLKSIPMSRTFVSEGPLYTELRLYLDREKAKDDAYLASLTDHARCVVLTQRRIDKCEQRFAEALDFTRHDRDDW